MPATVVERYGSLSATGIGTETSGFAQVATPTTFLPMAGNSLELDPGLFWPKVMMGQRDLNIFPVYGQYKNAGALNGPLFPSNAVGLISGSIGKDAATGYGVYGTLVTPTSTTVSVSSAAGATSITLTSGTGFVVGQLITVDSGGNIEQRKITNVATNVITVADAFLFAHASGVAAVSGTTTTTSGTLSIGATSVTVTSAAGITTGSFVQIDVNSVSGVTTSEVRKVTNVVTNTLTLDVGVTYAHASGVQVNLVQSLFYHNITQQNTLPSYTIEKNIGGFESLQFTGSRINKMDINISNGNQEATVAFDWRSKHSQVLATPSAITVTDESPFVFAETTLSLSNTAVIQATNSALTIENGLKDTYTFNGSHDLQFLTPVTRMVTFKCDVVFTSLDDPNWGYWTQMTTTPSTNFPVQLTFAHPTTGGFISFYMPKGRLKTYTDAIKMEDIVISTLTIDLGLQLSNLLTIQATIANSAYLAY